MWGQNVINEGLNAKLIWNLEADLEFLKDFVGSNFNFWKLGG